MQESEKSAIGWRSNRVMAAVADQAIQAAIRSKCCILTMFVEKVDEVNGLESIVLSHAAVQSIALCYDSEVIVYCCSSSAQRVKHTAAIVPAYNVEFSNGKERHLEAD